MSSEDLFPVPVVKAGRRYASAVVMITLPKSFHLITALCINGALYDFKYKVVFDKPSKVEAGAEIRCLNVDGSIRGEGVAKSPLETNYFSYRVIWLE